MILFLFAGTARAQEDYETTRGDLRLMWYNTENLFHPTDDSAAGDDEFIPGGVRGWSYKRYRQKLTAVARVIVAAGGWEPPDVVGLCEVECALVLEELVAHPILLPYGYSYLHREGPDHRGMDVACLFRGERLNPVSHQYITPPKGEGFDQTREMLHLKGAWGRRDTLELFLVHFISRYRGSGITANYRRRQSARLAVLMDSVESSAPGNLVVAVGDFNEVWGSYSLEPLDSVRASVGPDHGASYKYRGAWSGIDLFLVTGKSEAYGISRAVLKLPSILVPDLTFGGVKPYRTYEGFRYSGGYSDHLPVLLDISRSRGPGSAGR